MATNYRVSLGFVQFTDVGLSDFTRQVVAGLTDNAASFPNLPVSLQDLTNQGSAFDEKLAAAADGGRIATAEKNVARGVLVASLRQVGSYVQTVAGTNLPLMLSSGYQNVTNSSTQSPLPKPVVDNIDNFQSTMLMMRLKPIPNYRAIEVRRRQVGSEWQAAGIFTKAARIVLEDLTPGHVYEFQFRAIGGSTGYSDWSDPVSHMAT